MKVEQLLPSDLPHMEDYIRLSGAEQDLQAKKSQNGGIKLSDTPEKITKWMLVANLWRGRGMTVFISAFLSAVIGLPLLNFSLHFRDDYHLLQLPANLLHARDHRVI